MPDRNASILLSLRDTASAGTRAAAASFRALTAEELKAEQATLKMAQAYARLDAAQKNPAQGAQRLRDALASATIVTQQHGVAIQTQIASLDNQAARLAKGTTLAQEFGGAFKSGLIGIVGPAALAGGALTALIGTAESFKRAFVFKAELDATTKSIELQLRGVRDSGAAFASAAGFAQKYKFTQEETTNALRGSVSVLRASTSSAEDLLGVLARLQVLSPEQGLEGASLALKELSSGDVQSLVERFEISRTAANSMKAEIQAGGDAVQVVAKYLDSAGASMETLKIRTEGATGALNDQKIAAEGLALAQAKFAAGPGVVITQTYTGVLQILTNWLGQSAQAQEILNHAMAEMPSGGGGSFALPVDEIRLQATAYDEDRIAAGKAQIASQQFTQAIRLEGSAKVDAQIHTAELAQQQAQLDADSKAAAQGLFVSGDQALALAAKYGIAVDQARFLIKAQQTIGGGVTEARLERDTPQALAQARIAGLEGIRERAAAQDKAERDRLNRTGTTAQKLAQAQKDAANAATPLDKFNAQTRVMEVQQQLAQEQLRTAKSHTSTLDKQLGVNERIYDSITKQKDALLDIEELTIRDRQQDREDAAKLKTANAILNSPNASADLKARAADAKALIDVQDRQRANQLDEKRATAGGAIVNGRLLQSRPGDGSTPQQVGPSTPVGAGLPSASAGGGAGGGVLTVNVLIDGRAAWSGMSAFAWDDLMAGVQAVKAGKGA